MNINLNISPIKIIMLFYLLLMSNLITQKLNKHIIEKIHNNKLLQHVIGIITILILLCLIYNDMNIYDMAIYTFVIYFVFILSTKLNQNLLLISLILLLIFFLKEYYNKNKINIIINDENIDGITKEKKIKQIEKENFTINIIYGLVVIGGALLYDDKKYKQYGGNYTFKKFLEY
jgi:hypothetical protein